MQGVYQPLPRAPSVWRTNPPALAVANEWAVDSATEPRDQDLGFWDSADT